MGQSKLNLNREYFYNVSKLLICIHFVNLYLTYTYMSKQYTTMYLIYIILLVIIYLCRKNLKLTKKWLYKQLFILNVPPLILLLIFIELDLRVLLILIIGFTIELKYFKKRTLRYSSTDKKISIKKRKKNYNYLIIPATSFGLYLSYLTEKMTPEFYNVYVSIVYLVLYIFIIFMCYVLRFYNEE